MNILFYILASFATLFATPDQNGWVEVERSHKNSTLEHAGDEDDSSIWVLFSTRLGAEKFMARFPEDPDYTYISPDEMEINASQEGVTYHLRILPSSLEVLDQRAKEIAVQPGILIVDATRSSANTFDLLYQKEGKWVQEHLHLTPHHLYIFQTESDDFHGGNHQYFVDSLTL